MTIHEMSDRSNELMMRRRSFLKLAGGAAALAATGSVLTACSKEEAAKEQEAAPSIRAGQPEYDKIARCVCAPNCVGACGVNTYVKDDTIIKIEPAEFPDNSYHRVCLRGISNAMQRVYSADRVKYPMKRAGERGAGDWERISWEDAIELIYENMTHNIENYGSASNAWISMTGNQAAAVSVVTSMMASTFEGTSFTNFGIMGDNACNMGYLPPLAVQQDSSCWEDLIGSKTIIMFGCNYSETNMQEMHFVFDAQEAGSQLVVVDPRFSRTASKADWWIPIRPGTDAALILGMANYVVANKLYDEDYLRTYTNGAYLVDAATGMLARVGDSYLVWDESAKAAVKVAPLPDKAKPVYPSVQVSGEVPGECYPPKTAALLGEFNVECDSGAITAKPSFQLLVESLDAYGPEAASAICEVPADDIVKLAKLYVEQTPSSLRVSQGTNRYWNGHLPTRAAIELAGICGNIGKEHANVNWAGGSLMRFLFSFSGESLTPVKGRSAKALPGSQWLDLVAKQEPYPVKMLWATCYGIGTQGPLRQKMIDEVLPQLNFFVVSEQFMTPGAELADLVLPVCSYYEEPFEVVPSWSNMFLQIREQAISPLYESKTDWQAAQLIAERFGLKEGSLWDLDIKEFYRTEVFPKNVAPEFASVDFDELCEKKVIYSNYPEHHIAFESMRFGTPSGKIELYTESLLEYGEELAVHYEPYESNRNEKAAQYPLTFMNCRTVYTTHSQHVQLPWIREIAIEPCLEMAPADAAARGIATGDVVRVFNDRGEYQVKANVTEEIKPGCLNQRQGWWPKDFPDESHYGSMLHMALNPAQDAISETNYSPYDNLVQVEKL